MFGKGKILKHGEPAEALVTDADKSGYSNNHGINKWHLKLLVRYPDETTGNVTCSAYPTGPMGAFNPGDIVPVRYWPKDRSLVEVDHDAMLEAAEARHREGREGLIRIGKERLERGES
jgi:hypothetical protein